MKIVKENINFERGDPRKTLGLQESTIDKFTRIFEKFDIHLIKDPGYETVNDVPEAYGWEEPNWVSYSSYTFDVNDYLIPAHEDTYLIMELLTDKNGEEFFEFYFDSTPFFGDSRYYSPELQPVSIFNGEIVVEIIKYLEKNF